MMIPGGLEDQTEKNVEELYPKWGNIFGLDNLELYIIYIHKPKSISTQRSPFYIKLKYLLSKY